MACWLVCPALLKPNEMADTSFCGLCFTEKSNWGSSILLSEGLDVKTQARLTNIIITHPNTAQTSHTKVMSTLDVCTTQDKSSAYSLLGKISHGKDSLGSANVSMLLSTGVPIRCVLTWFLSSAVSQDAVRNTTLRVTGFLDFISVDRKRQNAYLMKRLRSAKEGG